MEIGTAEISPVDEEQLVTQPLTGLVRPSDEPGDAHYGGLCADVGDFRGDSCAYNVLYPELQRTGRLQDINFAVVVDERETDVRAGVGHMLKFGNYVLEFYALGFEELASRRNIVEEVAHGEVRAYRGDRLNR